MLDSFEKNIKKIDETEILLSLRKDSLLFGGDILIIRQNCTNKTRRYPWAFLTKQKSLKSK